MVEIFYFVVTVGASVITGLSVHESVPILRNRPWVHGRGGTVVAIWTCPILCVGVQCYSNDAGFIHVKL